MSVNVCVFTAFTFVYITEKNTLNFVEAKLLIVIAQLFLTHFTELLVLYQCIKEVTWVYC